MGPHFHQQFYSFKWIRGGGLMGSERTQIGQKCQISDNYLTDPIGVDNLADAFSYTHQLYDAIILDGAEKTRFLTNISCVETEGVSFTADLPLLAKHHTGGDSRHEHAQVQQSYR